MTLLTSAVNVFYRDVSPVVQIGLQLWLYVTPIAYPFSKVPAQWRRWIAVEPAQRHHRRLPVGDRLRPRARLVAARCSPRSLTARHAGRRLRAVQAARQVLRRCHLARPRSGSSSVSKRYRTGRSRTIVDLDRFVGRSRARPEQDVYSAARGRIGSTVFALQGRELRRGRRERGLGIIGSNGAGKTTLLKLISRVTWPTSGRVRVAGRVVSLIELGAGFHPELTGRENVYLGARPLRLDATRDRPAIRRDRAVRGSRAADRHADETLLVGPVRAARIQRRHSQPPRHRAGRRSAGGRRRRVPAPRAREPAPADRRTARPSSSSRTTCGTCAACAIGSSGWTKAACAPSAPPREIADRYMEEVNVRALANRSNAAAEPSRRNR